MQSKFIGFFFTLIGIMIMVIQSDLAPLTSLITWPFLLLLTGTFLLFTALMKKHSSLTLWGGLITALGLTIWGMKYIDGWSKHWGLLLALFGVAVLLQFMINRNKITGLVGIIMVLTGISAYPGFADLPIISPITSVIHAYWSVFIVILGLIFILKK